MFDWVLNAQLPSLKNTSESKRYFTEFVILKETKLFGIQNFSILVT